MVSSGREVISLQKEDSLLASSNQEELKRFLQDGIFGPRSDILLQKADSLTVFSNICRMY